MRNLILTSFLVVIVFSFLMISKERTQATSANSLLINEIMPDPAGTDSLYEWIEIYNGGNSSLNLADYKIGSSSLPNYQIGAGEYVILAKDVTNFRTRYQTTATVLVFNISLANASGILLLKDAAGNELQNFNYGQSSEEKSIELLKGGCGTIQTNINGNTVGSINNLCPELLTITPTTINSPTATVTTMPTSTISYSNLIAISRVHPYPETGEEWIELTNLDSTNINLEKWVLKDKTNNKYILPAVILQPGQSFIIYPAGVALNNDGDIIFLFSPDNKQVDMFSYAVTTKGQILTIASKSDAETEIEGTNEQSKGISTTKVNGSGSKYGIPRIYLLL